MITKMTKHELVTKRDCLYANLYQVCGQCSPTNLEAICRKINILSMKIQTFKGGLQND